jgi:hypothetical protein
MDPRSRQYFAPPSSSPLARTTAAADGDEDKDKGAAPADAQMHDTFAAMQGRIETLEKEVDSLRRFAAMVQSEKSLFDADDVSVSVDRLRTKEQTLHELRCYFDQGRAMYEEFIMVPEAQIRQRRAQLSAVDADTHALSNDAELAHAFARKQILLEKMIEKAKTQISALLISKASPASAPTPAAAAAPTPDVTAHRH